MTTPAQSRSPFSPPAGPRAGRDERESARATCRALQERSWAPVPFPPLADAAAQAVCRGAPGCPLSLPLSLSPCWALSPAVFLSLSLLWHEILKKKLASVHSTNRATALSSVQPENQVKYLYCLKTIPASPPPPLLPLPLLLLLLPLLLLLSTIVIIFSTEVKLKAMTLHLCSLIAITLLNELDLEHVSFVSQASLEEQDIHS